MARSSRSARAGLLLAGLLRGLVLALIGVRMYSREAEEERVEAAIRQKVNLPEDAFEVEEILPDRSIRVSLERVAIVERGGDTIVTAPRLRMVFDPRSVAGEGPLLFRDVQVENPDLRLVQSPAGEWNLMRAFALEADGERVGPRGAAEEEPGRGILLRGVRITGGRMAVATPWNPADSSLVAGPDPRIVRIGGRPYLLRTARAVEGRLPMARFGGPRTWRVEVGSATALLTEPEVGRVAMAGWVEATNVAGTGFRFELDQLRTGSSRLAGAGTVRFAEAGGGYDVTLRAAPLSFRDLQWIRPTLPAEGTARFALRVQSLDGERVTWNVRDAEVRALGSHVFGRLSAITREGAPPTFFDTRLTFDPLLFSTVERLGFAEEIPYDGRITGTVTSVEVVEGGRGGSLRVDLAASFVPEEMRGIPSSTLAANGLVGFGPAGVTFQGVRVEAEPLHLAALAPMVENGREQLRGVLRGSALLYGTPRDLRVEGGLLSYEVGGAPPSRVRLDRASFSLDPALRYRIEGRAEPLALATLTELYPALPFRAATLTGPFTVEGTRESMRFDTDLDGSAGGVAMRGTLAFGDPLRFDVSGRVNAFRTAAILTTDNPVEGPLTGTFAARGTAADFGFDVNLAQGAGRFALGGRVRNTAGGRQFDVSGRVDNFRVGLLVGRPGLLPDPVTGTLAVSGGGRQPYRFDVDLRGAMGVVDLEGTFAAGAAPTYNVSGRVQGLNLEGLPGMAMLPPTNLTGTVRLRGSGNTLETLAGELQLRAGGSTIAGIPVDTAVASLAVRGGVLSVDDLLLTLRGSRLVASGNLGLTRPAAGEPLRFTLQAQNLGTLAAVLPPPGPLEPNIAGSLAASGWVTGSVRAPVFGVSARGDGLRYEGWSAGRLALTAQGRREGTGWRGSGSIEGDRLVLAGREPLQSLRLEANVTPGTASFGLFARRNNESDVSAAGTLELDQGTLRGALLESLALRIGTSDWRLAGPARLRWGGGEGVAVDNLVLRRSGAATGWIEVDGMLPPTGNADLRVRMGGVDLAELRRIAGRGPDVQGILTLDAVIAGAVGTPTMSIRASVDSLRYQGVAADRVALDARYAGRRLVGNAEVLLRGQRVLTAEGTLPFVLSLEGGFPSTQVLRDEPVVARLRADSVPLGLLAAGIPGVSNGEGTVAADVNVAGTLDDPRVRGYASVAGGALDVDTLGTRWEEIGGRVSLEGNLIRIDSLVARSEGYARVDGTVRLDQPGRPLVYMTVSMEDFRAIRKRKVADLATSGRLAISGRFPSPTLTGHLVMDEGTITIPEFSDRVELEITDTEIGELGADTVSAALATTGVLGAFQVQDLRVTVENDVWLVSDDARVQIAGEVQVTRGPGSAVPLVYGEMQAIRGTYTLHIGPIEREFEVERGRVEFFGTQELNPLLDIVAAHEVRTATREAGRNSALRILVNITGTLQEPRLALTSETRPPLPEEELFNYLVFGQPSFALGAGTGQLAQQIFLQSFLAGYVAGGIERELARTGLVDFVRVRTGPAGAAGGLALPGFDIVGGALGLGGTIVDLGWEIGEGVFFTLQVGELFTQPTLGFGLEWEIDENWSLRAALEDPQLENRYRLRAFQEDVPRRQWSTDVFWRREFGQPRSDPPRVITPPEETRPLPGEVPRPEQRRDAPPERPRAEQPRTEEPKKEER